MNIATLGDVAEWGSGGTPSRAIDEYFGAGVPWLSIADLTDGVVTESKEQLTAAGIAASTAKIVPPGTILVAMYGSIGKLGIAGRALCTSQAIAFAKPDNQHIDTQYMFHYLLSQRRHLQASGRGGTQMNIGQADLKSWPVPLPPLEKQRRIAAVLDRADAMRAKRRQVLAHLDALEFSTFQAMFPDYFGRTADRVPLESVLFGIDSGASPVCEARPAEFDEWGVLKLGAVTYGTFRSEENKAYLGSLTGMERNEVHEGDVLMTRKNTRELVGAVAVVGQTRPRLLMPDLVFRLRLDPDRIDPAYFQAFMMARKTRETVRNLSSGSAASMPNISKARLSRLRIYAPPLGRQVEFAERRQSIDVQREVTKRQLAAEGELFVSLQARAFRSEQ